MGCDMADFSNKVGLGGFMILVFAALLAFVVMASTSDRNFVQQSSDHTEVEVTTTEKGHQ